MRGQADDFCPLYTADSSSSAVSQFDKDDVEAIGLVKFDFLGLTTLTILDWTLRYIRQLSDKDLALDRSMIPLGSCTMKLNATSEMIPITWPEFAGVHPFAPAEQLKGYAQLDQQLRDWLCQATGYKGISLQPNAAAKANTPVSWSFRPTTAPKAKATATSA